MSSEGYEVKSAYHFKGRLFDRDTLFVHQYQMNFLFILKAYTLNQTSLIQEFRTKTKERSRNYFINYFNESGEYFFYDKSFSTNDLEKFVIDNFRILNGKCIRIENGEKLLIAIFEEEFSTAETLLRDFTKVDLS